MSEVEHPYAKMAVVAAITGFAALLVGNYSGITIGQENERARWEAKAATQFIADMCLMAKTGKLPQQDKTP